MRWLWFSMFISRAAGMVRSLVSRYVDAIDANIEPHHLRSGLRMLTRPSTTSILSQPDAYHHLIFYNPILLGLHEYARAPNSRLNGGQYYQIVIQTNARKDACEKKPPNLPRETQTQNQGQARV